VSPRYQRKDTFHQRAKREGYRSRAAYKLAEIADRQRLLTPGARVADLGCWPGGWLQVAAERVGPTGRVVGVDLATIEPPLENANVVALVGDIAQDSVLAEVLAALGGPADVLLCDAAPKLTGIRDADRAREEALLEAVAAALPRLLRPGGDLLCKLLDSPEAESVGRRIGAGFRESRTLRPEATRKGSAERYLLARGFSPKASRA
jgi:23S rRNA (uridine2552-2'-O)-methyltransferase